MLDQHKFTQEDIWLANLNPSKKIWNQEKPSLY